MTEQESCDPQSNFNFITLYYCGFDKSFGKKGKIAAFIPVGILFMAIFMYILSETADAYLSPSLETMTTKFRIPESLAGVTLLALGNGAPDVFSSIAAVGEESPDGVKSTAIIVGGTFFISAVVVAVTVRASNINEDPNGAPIHKIKVTPSYFIRDISFYILTCIYLLIILLGPGFFNLWTSIGLLVIYIIYVATVVLMSKKTEEDEEDANVEANLFVSILKQSVKAASKAGSVQLSTNPNDPDEKKVDIDKLLSASK